MRFAKILLPLLLSATGISGVKAQNIDSNALDLEFNSSQSVEGFSVDGGSISHAHQTAMLVSGNENLCLVSPQLSMQSGNKYSALLPARNTIFVRLKNSTNASKVKVHFVTNKNSVFTDNQSKEFDIEPNSDYKSYFFNLSDNRVFTKSKIQDGEYLKQFKLTFDNTESGSIEIEAFSFEREDAIVRYVGEIYSCLADKEAKTVSIKGKVNSAYKTKTVTVLQSDAQNYDDRIDYANSVTLAEVKPESDGTFDATFSLMRNEQTTHLASKFIVICDGKRVDKTTMISNIQDFSVINKEERFKIPETIFNVLDYGAKGDAFTNDTNAIQAAIDAATVNGGVVYIPGDTTVSTGRRYIMTHVDMKSNVELRIEKGAVLWQSPRQDEYHYCVPGYEEHDKPVYGHDLDMNGIMWCHACATVNLPFIYTEHATNVRITGGGELRMMDPGVEVEDAQVFLGDPSTNHACHNILHLSPLCAFDVINYDVTNIEIHKASGWHCSSTMSQNVWYSNIIEYNTCCVTSDGMSTGTSKDVVIERCMTYTSDDGLVISSNYQDPRDFMARNNATITREFDYKAERIYAAHNFAWGGFGCSFIPWGSPCPDFDKIGIKGVEIYDNVLGGQKSVGVWNDDPYYGYSKYGTYNSTEDNDYAPMSDVHFHGNTYLNGFQYYLNGNRMPVTNLLVEDTDEYSSKAPSTFQHGSFDKNVRVGTMYDDETNWTVGLSNWTYDGDESVIFGTEKVKEGLNYSGYIKGNGRLYQGLYEYQGFYRVSMKTYSKAGDSYFFVQDRITGEYLAKEKFDNSSDFVDHEFYFNNLDERLLFIGVMHKGDDQTVYFDDCRIIRVEDAKFYDAYALETFENDYVLLVDDPVIETVSGNKMLKVSSEAVNLEAQYSEFDLGFNFVSSSEEETFKLTLSSEDQNKTYNVELNNLNDEKTHYLGIRITTNGIKTYIDYQLVSTLTREDNFAKFNVAFSAQNKLLIDNLLVTTLDEATLEKQLAVIKIDNAENYILTPIAEGKFVGETYSFTLTTDDEVEVTINGEHVSDVGGVYSFILEEENTIEITKKVTPIESSEPIESSSELESSESPTSSSNIVDSSSPSEPSEKKGCGGNISTTAWIVVIVCLSAIGLLMFAKSDFFKKKSIKALTIVAILLGSIISFAATTLSKTNNVVADDVGTTAVLKNKSITGGSEYLSFTDDTVTNTGNAPSVWTELVWGSQNDGTVETTSFDITCHYSNGTNGILTLQFNRWDAAQLYKVSITQTSMTWTRWAWSPSAGTGVPVETLGEVGFGLKDGVTYHIDYIRKSWDKMLFVNGTKVFYVCQGELTVGCLGIETWELGYEITNLKRTDGYDTDLWNMSTLDSYKDQLVSQLNGEINKISETAVRVEAGKLISKFIAELNKVFLKSDMDALYEEYKQQILALNVDDVANMSKMKKVYTGLEYIGATDPTKYQFTKFDTIYLGVANNNESSVAYSDSNFTNKYVASIEFSPQILNYWTICEFRFNFIDSSNYHAMRMTDHSIEYIRVEAGSVTKTFFESTESSAFQTYRYTVEGNGNNVKLYVNGVLKIEDAVSTPTNKVCFRVWNGGFCISDVTYFSYETLQDTINFISSYELGSTELKNKYIGLVHSATCEARVKSLKYQFKNVADAE